VAKRWAEWLNCCLIPKSPWRATRVKTAFAIVSTLLSVSFASAHFVFILPPTDGQSARVVLSDTPSADPKASAESLTIKSLSGVSSSGEKVDVARPSFEKALGTWLFPRETQLGAGVCTSINYGVVNRGEGDRYLIRHHAKLVVDLDKAANLPPAPLEIAPRPLGGGVAFTIQWNGKPLTTADVMVFEPGATAWKILKTDLNGTTATFTTPGLYAARVAQIDPTPGEFEGRRYKSVKHYSTVTVSLRAK
jgi:hypothetical protein